MFAVKQNNRSAWYRLPRPGENNYFQVLTIIDCWCLFLGGMLWGAIISAMVVYR